MVIWTIDPVEHGPGRVWRTDQPGWLTMNATAGEVTVHSPDNHLLAPTARAGASSFARWTASGPGCQPELQSADYPQRRHYGSGQHRLRVDRVVLATGHAELAPLETEAQLREHADRHPGLCYIGQGLTTEMSLSAIAPGATVAVRGLGLSFYDMLRSLALGRGGRFRRSADGTLRYLPSGREPVLCASSRGRCPSSPGPE